MSGLRVTFITPYPPGGGGVRSGVEHFARRLATSLADAGAEVTVIAQRLAGEPNLTADGTVAVRRAFSPGPMALPDAARAAEATGADVIHVQHEVFLFGGPPSVAGLPWALHRLKRSGAGVVVTMHQVVEPASIDAEFTRLHRVRVPAGLARLALGGVQDTIRRQADATIVHEQAFAEVVEGSHVVPLGIDRPAGAHPATHHVAARRLKLDDARLTVLCFGFLSPYKGLEQALEAARLAGPEVDLVLAGGPHPRLQRNGRDGYAEALASGYKETARFTGYVPEHEVAPCFAAADVVLIPYPRPFSSSGPLAQALGHQRPVLLSEAMARCAGATDDLATSIEPEALAARLVRLARQPDERDRLARASAQLAEGRTWPAVAQRHLAIYGEVTSAQHPQRAARRAVRR